MDNSFDTLLAEFLDGDAGPDTVARLCDLLKNSPELQSRFREEIRMHTLMREIGMEAIAGQGKAWMANRTDSNRRRWFAHTGLLALAASLAVVAGGVWWLSQRPDASQELRVAEVRGSGVRSQGSGVRSQAVATESPRHPVTESKATSHKPLRVGDVLRPGDGVEVGADGYAKLAYPDGTQIDLHGSTRLRVTLGEGENKDAKRLALDGGRMVCEAAAQRKALEIQTRQAVSRVVGTRFSLGVTEAVSRLAVMEGKVELIQGEKSLLVGTGKAAIATATGMEMVRDVVYVWGQNQYGQLGNGTTNDCPNPVPVPGLDGVVAVAAGNSHTVALKDDGSVWAWGDNRWGQLGNGTTNASQVPILVAGLNDITAITVGGTFAMALNADGTVWAWGANHAGQLGNGTINDSLRPMQVRLPDGSSFSGVRALAAGLGHAVALKGNGSVWTWGLNDQRQISGGSNKYYCNPVPVKRPDGTALTDCLAIAAGGRHTLALRADRTVWAWGDNNGGQLGDGHAYCVSSIPVQVKAFDGTYLSNVTALAAGLSQTVALKTDGTVWGWGSYGATYSGITRSTVTAAPMTAPDGAAVSDALAIATSLRRTLVLKKDGTVWGCGYKMERGAGAEQSSLVQVVWPDGSGVQKIIAVAAGNAHSVAIREE